MPDSARPDRSSCAAQHDVAGSAKPADAAQERAWYQYYFCTPRGIAGLTENRGDIAKLLWQLWRVGEPFDAVLFEKSAPSFDNPDFVEVVIHSYRVRYGYVAGDPALAHIEAQLAAQPKITVPTIVLHGEADGIAPPQSSAGHAKHFTGQFNAHLRDVVLLLADEAFYAGNRQHDPRWRMSDAYRS